MPADVDYKVSLQLVDDNGALLTQHDGDPYEGRFPTSRWQVGETVPDRHHLTLTGATAAWSARVVVYEPISGQRLPVGERDYFVLPPVTP